MLQALRSGAKSPVMKFFLLFLAGGFALWGIGDGTTGLIGGSDKAVSAGDVAISPRRVAIEFDRARRNFLPNNSTEEALQGGLLNEVTGALSRDVLLRAESNELGLTVTRAMQREAIRNENSFKDELGQFSEGRFMQVLASAGLNEADYLQRVDGALFRDQLIGAVAAGARFDSATARAVAAFDLERRKVRLTSFAVTPEKMATPDDAMIDAFFAENKTAYRAPDMRSARIAIVSAEMIAKDLTIADADIKAAYDQRLDEFATPETRDIRQMVFDDAAKAKTAIDRLNKDEAFIAIAKDMLNWAPNDTAIDGASRDTLDTALAEAAFTAAIGTPVGPIESPFGHHVLVVEAITAGGTPALGDIRDEISDKLRAEQAMNLLYERANAMEDALGTGATLSEAAEKVGGTIETVANIDRNGLTIDGVPLGGEIGELVQDSAVLELIWETRVNETSVIQEGTDDSFFVIEVTGETAARERPLDEVKTRVVADWKTVEAVKAARQQADAAAAKNDDSAPLSPAFRRNGNGLDHQAAGLIARTAFGQDLGTGTVIETGTEAILVKTAEIIPATDDDISTTATLVTDMLNTAMRDDMLNMVLIALSEKHDLQINTGAVRQILIGSQ